MMTPDRANNMVQSEAMSDDDYMAQFADRGRLQRRLLIAILALCVVAGLASWITGHGWVVKYAFAFWIVAWLGSGYVFNRCPRCRKFLDGRMAEDGSRDDPFVCPHCGARLRRAPS